MKKYEFTRETKETFGGTILHRIWAVRDFGNVKKGELGGWIENGKNLSHDGDCWVEGNAWVLENARVSENAWVRGNAVVRGNAIIEENAWVSENTFIGFNSHVGGNARIRENAIIGGSASVTGNVAIVGEAVVVGDSCIGENVCIRGNAYIEKNACISKSEDYLVVGPIGSRNGFTTFYKNKDDGISVSCGCFLGTIEEFLERVKETHGDNRYAKEYINAIDLAKIRIS